eukprot:TRINITY_DN5526_c0_g1_i1.p1 TRINITY_DN5526_c0_g1~~TRINITY_DN5526_c0_g1_i1.p1  ORF type:complete len:673 (+),score=184.31 TRINITY_DN5526_c0_g1_i1:51-2069(+)
MGEGERLAAIGLDKVNVDNILKNKELTTQIVGFLDSLKVEKCEKNVGLMLYGAIKAPESHRQMLGEYIVGGKLKNSKQSDAAVKYLLDISKNKKEFSQSVFDQECGAGIDVSQADITAAVSKGVESAKDKITSERYAFNRGRFLGDLRKDPALKWADGESIKTEVDKQIDAMLGPKTEADIAATEKKKPAKKEPVAKKEKVAFSLASQTDAQKKLIRDGMGYRAVYLCDVPKHEGETIVIRGWTHNIRSQGNLHFIVLRDGTSYVQCVVRDKTLPEISRETSFVFRGVPVFNTNAAKSKHVLPYEVTVSEWAITGLSSPEVENVVNADSKPHVLLNQRHMVLRGTKTAALMKIRSHALKAFRDHFFEKKCMEVQPPTMVQTQCEGGGSLFNLDFYGQKAYLTQSSQLYLETAIPMIGDCYCILPSYRAEQTHTKRHLSEFTHIEAEYPFITFEDLLDRLEDLVIGVLTRLLDSCGDEIRRLNPKPCDGYTGEHWKKCYIPKKPFNRLTHADAVKFCRKHNIYKNEETKEHFGPEDDIPDAPERKMIAKIGEPTFMINFPTSMKSFYMKRVEGNPDLTESVDLLMPGIGEIIGGSMRMDDLEELMSGYEREGLNPDPYYWFTDQRKYGSTPHGGFGLGLERFLVWLCNDTDEDNCDHVRDMCLFPRVQDRCTP